jgi:hypothetical protein
LGDCGINGGLDEGCAVSPPGFAVVTFGEVGGVVEPEAFGDVKAAVGDAVGGLGDFVPTVPGALVSGALFAISGLDDVPFA